MKKPSQLTGEELLAVVHGVIDAMYPGANPDSEWSPDTLDEVAAVLAAAELVPDDEVKMVHCDHCGVTVPLDDCESTYCGSIHLDCGAIKAHAQECEICRHDFKERGLL